MDDRELSARLTKIEEEVTEIRKILQEETEQSYEINRKEIEEIEQEEEKKMKPKVNEE